MEFLLTLKEQGADPEPLRNPPRRKAEFQWLFEAYSLLSRSRQVGMTEFYIPLSEYAAYLDIACISDMDDRLLLVAVLTQVDAILLSERMQEVAGNPR